MTTPLAGLLRVGLELEHLGLERDHLEQLLDALAGLGAETSQKIVSPPHSSGWRPELDELALARARGRRPACRSC